MNRDSGGPASRPHVVVVGGGVTGLSCAYRLVRAANGLPLEVTLLEASERLGGKLRTVDVGGVRVEGGADSFVVRKPWAVDLCKELGLGGELVVPAAAGASVWARGRLVPYIERSAFGIPSGVGALLRWPALSLRGRIRAATEFLRPIDRSGPDESIGSMARRRLGEEAARVLVGPLLAGLHAGDPERLSVRATFPELMAWERGHDSLIRGARASLKAVSEERAGSGGDRPAIFATVWGGLGRLVDALEAAVGPIRVRKAQPVEGLGVSEGRFVLHTASGSWQADAVVLATPALEAARLLAEVNGAAAAELRSIPYVSTAAVILVYGEGSASMLPRGTGFVAPPGELTITAATWLSRKWPLGGTAEPAVVRCFVGRAGEEAALDLGDDELIRRVRADLAAAAGLRAEPRAASVIRWPSSMPQYEVGHLDRLERIASHLAATPGIFVAGSAYRGVGIADCVRQGGDAAVRVREYVRSMRPRAGGEEDRATGRSRREVG